MHVGFQHVAVGLGADRLSGTVFFFFEHRPSGLDHHSIDLPQQLFVHMTDVFRKGLWVEGLLLVRKHGGQTQNLPQQSIVIGQIRQAVVVTAQRQAHDPQNQNVPQVQTRSPSGLLAPPSFSSNSKTWRLSSGVWKIHCKPASTGGSSSRLQSGSETLSIAVLPKVSWTSNR